MQWSLSCLSSSQDHYSGSSTSFLTHSSFLDFLGEDSVVLSLRRWYGVPGVTVAVDSIVGVSFVIDSVLGYIMEVDGGWGCVCGMY